MNYLEICFSRKVDLLRNFPDHLIHIVPCPLFTHYETCVDNLRKIAQQFVMRIFTKRISPFTNLLIKYIRGYYIFSIKTNKVYFRNLCINLLTIGPHRILIISYKQLYTNKQKSKKTSLQNILQDTITTSKNTFFTRKKEEQKRVKEIKNIKFFYEILNKIFEDFFRMKCFIFVKNVSCRNFSKENFPYPIFKNLNWPTFNLHVNLVDFFCFLIQFYVSSFVDVNQSKKCQHHDPNIMLTIYWTKI